MHLLVIHAESKSTVVIIFERSSVLIPTKLNSNFNNKYAF